MDKKITFRRSARLIIIVMLVLSIAMLALSAPSNQSRWF